MKQIKVIYPYLFWTREKTIECPASWEEMNGRQFLLAVKLQFEQVDDISVVSEFLGLSRRLVARFDSFQLYSLTNLIEFIVFPKATLNRFYINRIPKTKLVAPADKLRNVDMKRFMLFDTLFFDYLNHKKEDDLVRMIAMLYLGPNETTDTIDIADRIRYIEKHVDKITMNAILLNYIFIRKWLAKAYPYVFSFNEKEEKETTRNKPDPAMKPNRPDWIGIMDDFIGDDFVNSDNYYRKRAMDVFRIINRRIINFKKHGFKK